MKISRSFSQALVTWPRKSATAWNRTPLVFLRQSNEGSLFIGWIYVEWKENDGTCSLVGSTMLWSMAVITASQIVQVTKLPGEDLLIFLGDEWSIRQCWIRGEICPGRQSFMEQVIPPSACWIARVGAPSTVALRRTRRSCILVNVVSEIIQKITFCLAYHQL